MNKKNILSNITQTLIGSGSAITSSTFPLNNLSIELHIASCSALLTSFAILITNEFISKLKIRYTELKAWMNVISLLYEKLLKIKTRDDEIKDLKYKTEKHYDEKTSK